MTFDVPCPGCGQPRDGRAPTDCTAPLRHVVGMPDDFRKRVKWHADRARREREEQK